MYSNLQCLYILKIILSMILMCKCAKDNIVNNTVSVVYRKYIPLRSYSKSHAII